jgi:hypothetical protein
MCSPQRGQNVPEPCLPEAVLTVHGETNEVNHA